MQKIRHSPLKITEGVIVQWRQSSYEVSASYANMSLVPSILFAVRVYSKRPLWGHQPRRRSRLRPGYALLRVAASSGTGSRLSGSSYKNQDTCVFTLSAVRESFHENRICEFFDRFNPTHRLNERTGDDPPEIEPVSERRHAFLWRAKYQRDILCISSMKPLHLCTSIDLCLKDAMKKIINEGLGEYL